ncbi:sugar phosphate isomerase/epimerase [Paenibacillus sp. IB182496]|uniref:Sugar phosphate isomerase/epimerase n=1 Tax=Paenibacillus sabuli TaxID=2772509 RepID=A0A927BT19_9BACL|nr:TIM barrel protein [Paenibacillus sabuli]MBD2844989.1 sugar phosphate isomerase/epimerase [Paenibacillus sabuli]
MNVAVNSWSLEKELGALRMMEWSDVVADRVMHEEEQPEAMTLTELCARLGQSGYRGLELTYAQIKDMSDDAMLDLRGAAKVSNVELSSLLLDYGDLSSDDEVRRQADLKWYKEWIDAASKAGFTRVRVPGGDSAPDDAAALSRAADGLSELAAYSERYGVLVVTENLGELLSTSANCQQLLEQCKGRVGFTADFGNFRTDKYKQLAEVLPYAETVHAKAETDSAGALDEADFKRCIALCVEAGFSGSYALTYLGQGDAWERLTQMRSLAEEALAATQA